MDALQEARCFCPYCGEPNVLLIDCTFEEQSYVEDCAVCCQPMCVDVEINGTREPQVRLTRENA